MSDERPEASEPEPDLRPPPRYGVYATPEEQRARIRKPDATHALETGESVAHPVADTTVAGQEAPRSSAPGAIASAGLDSTRARAVDRIVTFGLLAYAFVNVAVATVGLLDFSEYAATVFAVLGIPGEFTNVADGQAWGTAAAIALVIGYLVTAWFAVRRMLRGKLAWWVPLAGAVVTHLVVGVLAVVPLMADPAFTSYMSSLS